MKAKPGGVYLKLFHGRRNPKTDMDNWGSEGPIFGPMEYVHTTYGSCVKLGFVDDQALGVAETMLQLAGDMLYYDGVFYGDWSTFLFAEDMPEMEVSLFSEALAWVPPDLTPSTPKTVKDGDATLMRYAPGDGRLKFSWTEKQGTPPRDVAIRRPVLFTEAACLLPAGWRFVMLSGTPVVSHAIPAEMPELSIAQQVWESLFPDRQPWHKLRPDVQTDWRNVVRTVLEVSTKMAKADDGTDQPDGHDWEGFVGGCARMGCPPHCSPKTA